MKQSPIISLIKLHPDGADAGSPTRRFGQVRLREESLSQRIMHGSEAQWSGGLANKSGDSALVFHPSGEVDIYEELLVDGTDPARDGDLVLHDIIRRYFPDKVLTH